MASMGDIRHFVILMMENRSFDHYLGALNFEGRRDIEGLAPDSGEPMPTNRRKEGANDTSGPGVAPWPMDDAHLAFEDPPHEWREVRQQWNDGKMDGFVATFQRHHEAAWQAEENTWPSGSPLTGALHTAPMPDFGQMARAVMGYYTRKTLPVLYHLCDEFAVCDHWHASFLGSTHPNRVFALGGQCGDILTTTWKNAFRHKPDPIVAAWEKTKGRKKGISWKTYRLPNELSVFSLWPGFANGREANAGSLTDFARDCAADALPDVAYLEPPYSVADDHPTHDPVRGQQFMGYIVNALLASPSFRSTAMIITYDEHGGFFDHVKPPAAPEPKPVEPRELLGIRVPTIVLSPFTTPGGVVKDVLEHTTILKTIAERFELPIPAEAGPRLSLVRSLWETAAFDFGVKARGGKDLTPPTPSADWRLHADGDADGPTTSDFADSLYQLAHVDKLAALKATLEQ
jgi:phospholipase C